MGLLTGGLGGLKERTFTCHLNYLLLICSRDASGAWGWYCRMQLILESRSTMGKIFFFFFFSKSRCNGGDCQPTIFSKPTHPPNPWSPIPMKTAILKGNCILASLDVRLEGKFCVLPMKRTRQYLFAIRTNAFNPDSWAGLHALPPSPRPPFLSLSRSYLQSIISPN